MIPIKLTPAEAHELAELLAATQGSGARVAVDSDGFKISIDQGMWTPGYGEAPPPPAPGPAGAPQLYLISDYQVRATAYTDGIVRLERSADGTTWETLYPHAIG